MKKSLLRSIFALTLVLVFGLLANARAELNLDFTLVNSTGDDIKEIYISPTASDDWGDNLLKGVLKDGQKLELTFSPKAKAAKWDIKAVYTDGGTPEWKGYKLTEIETITLYWDGKQTRAKVE